MIKMFFQVISLVFAAFLFSSCSSVMVTHDFDNNAPFSDYSAFAIAAKNPDRKTDPRYDNEILNNRFSEVIIEKLETKGLSPKSTTNQADIVVSYDFSIRPKMDIYNINKQMGFSYGSYHRYGGVSSPTCTDISEFDQGLLFIDIRDSKTNQLVWRGTGADIISINATPEKISTQVSEMVEAIFREYPPSPKS